MPDERRNALMQRRLCSVQANGITLLDAVEQISDTGARRVSLFFETVVDPAKISFGKGWIIADSGTAAGVPWFVVCASQDGPVDMQFDTAPVQITPAQAELDLLKATNAVLAIRNGESAETVITWLEYHCTHHRMTSAVILDRARPGSDPGFATQLSGGLARAAFTCQVVLIDADVPLGKAGLPAESHPINAPDAPGKDRMDIPPDDPWAAPLGSRHIYEIARCRLLGKARAVANIDVCDLLAPESDSVFDRVSDVDGGLIQLQGQHCYPWRLRQGKPTRFSDHICVQFDKMSRKRRWCICPARLAETAVWLPVRIGGVNPDKAETGQFYRFMALRHPIRSVSKIVPKTALIEHPPLLSLATDTFGEKPVRLPPARARDTGPGPGRRVIVTTMKNEGPFILEWIAHHRAVGFDDILVYTNDCSDGTDTLLELLQSKGIVQHRDNPFRAGKLKPQHAALRAAQDEPVVIAAKWVACIDVDEFINIKTGAGTLDDLFTAVPDANMIAMTWRLFGNANIHAYDDGFVTDKFTRCAAEFTRKPHQAWGFKTLFQNIGLFKKLGVHRPKGLNGQLWDQINWVNGSGQLLPRNMYRNAWRSSAETYGYDLVSLNHYAVRSAESFLVKRDRGRVNHVDRDQGLAYWFRMNNNAETDQSISRISAAKKREYETLMADRDIAAMHAHCVKMHHAKIMDLRASPKPAQFYVELTSQRLENLSLMHARFGANVFMSGPGVIPDEIAARAPAEDFFFTVERLKAAKA